MKRQMRPTRVTIVTPSLNQGEFISEAIESVLDQGYPHLQYFVADGGSTDGTARIIKRYERHLAGWWSSPDGGQAAAIAIALERATGDVFHWINADDVLSPGALATVCDAMEGHDAVAGGCRDFFDDGSGPDIVRYQRGLSAAALLGGSDETVFHQPALWLRRVEINRVGGLDTGLRYVFDWDLSIRYLAEFPRVAYVPEVLASFRLHARSKTVSEGARFEDEREAVLRKLAGSGRQISVRARARRRLRQREWWRTLEALEAETRGSGLSRAARVAAAALRNPTVAMNRLTAGAVLAALREAESPSRRSSDKQ